MVISSFPTSIDSAFPSNLW